VGNNLKSKYLVFYETSTNTCGVSRGNKKNTKKYVSVSMLSIRNKLGPKRMEKQSKLNTSFHMQNKESAFRLHLKY
jgi:hypothetical protein